MRLVGLLLVAIGVVIVWDVLHGKDPQAHLQDLVNLLGHQHASGTVSATAAPAGQLQSQLL